MMLFFIITNHSKIISFLDKSELYQHQKRKQNLSFDSSSKTFASPIAVEIHAKSSSIDFDIFSMTL